MRVKTTFRFDYESRLSAAPKAQWSVSVAGEPVPPPPPRSDAQATKNPLKADSSHICISRSHDFSFSPSVSHSPSQTFLRELDKKLWTAIKESGPLAHPYKITSTGKLIDDALEAVEKENPKLKNVPVASVCDRRTLNHRIARRKPHDFEPNRRRPKPRKTSDGRRPTQLQIDLIATIPFLLTNQFAKSVSLERAIKANLKELGNEF